MPEIYIDALRRHDGRLWCHMYSHDLAALDAFAARIGVSSYRQIPTPRNGISWPHYDLTEAGRAKALAAGAIEHDRFQFVAEANAIRRRWALDNKGAPGLPLEQVR